MSDDILARFDLERGSFRLSVDAHLPGCGITALFGRSGAGKTTLLRCMAGLELANNGLFSLNGTCWQNDERGVFIPPHRRQLGYIYRQGRLHPHMPVRENLEYGYRSVALGNNEEQKRQTLKRVVEVLGIGSILRRYPHQLTVEEKRRVVIGRALMIQPHILLMDEPMTGLDLESKALLMPYLEALHTNLNIPVLYVGHDVEELVHVADRLLTMDEGRVTEIGDVPDMLARLDLAISEQEGAGVLLEVGVVAHDEAFILTKVVFSGGELLIPQVKSAIGQSLRVRIQARDVSISLVCPRKTSVLNVLKAQIIALLDQPNGMVLLRLDLAGTALFAQVSRKAKVCLRLKVGTRVFAQIKNIALYG
ncbi:MAG: molybdenum ABC transporter ATP-binding protein [Gammaproteobacteria bacterium]|nr:molybdenum ABC transporter ATP-binding protein [Gammaproteobacteria bacterium]